MTVFGEVMIGKSVIAIMLIVLTWESTPFVGAWFYGRSVLREAWKEGRSSEESVSFG
jgi:hypothetical protein